MSNLYNLYVTGIDSSTSAYWVEANVVWLAQTFTPHVGYDISSVVLKNYRTGAVGNVTVSIRATDVDTGKPTGPDLASATIDGTAIIPAGAGIGDAAEITYTFDSPYTLVSGTKYAIVLKSPQNETTYVRWLIDTAGATYPGGSYSISNDGGSTWALDISADFYFKTYGEGLLVDYYKIGDDSGVGFYSSKWKAQTFTASEGYAIEGVGLKLYRQGSPGTLTISIRATDVNDKPTGPDLASVSMNPSTITTSSIGEWLEFVFSSSYALQNGTRYAIVLRTATGDISNRVFARADISSPEYTEGESATSVDSGGSWILVSSVDLMFETFKSGDVAPAVSDQSTDSAAMAGAETTLSVTATGTPSPTYQWHKDDVLMSGETNSTLTIYPTSTATYKCKITNDAGSIWSDPIVVTVVENSYVYNPFDLPLDIDRIT